MDESQLVRGITDPIDSDVLCGRGGASLRHPGNQTYRRLVNLNKGLYTTCLKTEKLKISRSIVAAIREQKGRFLEKDNDSGTWYDIGDKKAIEKTSQALREGQPKLRQKIQEMGGGPTNAGPAPPNPAAAAAAAVMEQQYGHVGIYPEQVGLSSLQQNQVNSNNRDVLSSSNHTASTDSLMPPPRSLLNNQSSLHSTIHSSMDMSSAHTGSRDPYYMNSRHGNGANPSNHSGSNDYMLSSNHSNFSSDMSAIGGPSLHQPGGGLSMEAFMALARHSTGSDGFPLHGNTNSLQRMQQHQQRHQSHPSMPLGIMPNGTDHSSTMRSNVSNFSMEPYSIAGDSNHLVLGHSDHTHSSSQSSAAVNYHTQQAASSSLLDNRSVLVDEPSLLGDSPALPPRPSSMPESTASLRPPASRPMMSASATARGFVPRPSMVESSRRLQVGGSTRKMYDYSHAEYRDHTAPTHTSSFSHNESIAESMAETDRRRAFAKMKYDRPPSSRTTASGHRSDGMPDIHMVESQLSILSNLSLDSKPLHDRSMRSKKVSEPILEGEIAEVVDHSAFSNHFSSSKHSIMSGLSRTSEMDHSIFSDLSRKIGNVSTRSIAMSEFSGIELGDHRFYDEASFSSSPRRQKAGNVSMRSIAMSEFSAIDSLDNKDETSASSLIQISNETLF